MVFEVVIYLVAIFFKLVNRKQQLVQDSFHLVTAEFGKLELV